MTNISRSGPCLAEGCLKPRDARGFCKMHYSRWKRNGEAGIVERMRSLAYGDTQCNFDQCEDKAQRKGFCEKHYMSYRRAINRAYLHKIKLERGCIDCGFNEHPAALHFDHVRGEKSFILSKGVGFCNTKSLDEEIEKCEVRCANCHAIKTHDEQDYLNVTIGQVYA